MSVVQDLMPGDILLVRGTDMHRARKQWVRMAISWVIEKLTGSPYSHAGMWDGTDIVDVDVFRTVGHRKLQEYDGYDVYRVIDAAEEDRRKAVFFVWARLGESYDYTAILAFGLYKLFGWSWNPNDPQKWFCSELVEAAWEQAGHDLVPGEPDDRVAPGDLARSQQLRFIKKGTG